MLLNASIGFILAALYAGKSPNKSPMPTETKNEIQIHSPEYTAGTHPILPIMAIIPIPPTTSEIATIPTSTIIKVSVTLPKVSSIASLLVTLYQSSSLYKSNKTLSK